MSPSPLLRDMGSSNIAPAPSEARMQLLPPLPFPKGCGWLGLARGRNGGVRGAKGDIGGGRPSGYVVKTGYNVCLSPFFSHHFFSQPQPTFNDINPHTAPTTHIATVTTTRRRNISESANDDGNTNPGEDNGANASDDKSPTNSLLMTRTAHATPHS